MDLLLTPGGTWAKMMARPLPSSLTAVRASRSQESWDRVGGTTSLTCSPGSSLPSLSLSPWYSRLVFSPILGQRKGKSALKEEKGEGRREGR